MGDERQLQVQELDVLDSIYGKDFVRSVSNHCYEIQFSHVRMVLHLPADYPSCSPPILELHDSSLSCLSSTEALGKELFSMFTPGDVVLFDWIENIKDMCDQAASRDTEEEEEVVGASSALPSTEDQAKVELDELKEAMELVSSRIITGEAFLERKSTFQAHIAQITSPIEAKAMVEVLLQSSNKIRSASHNMMAYRIEIKDGIFAQDFDDDGEAAAGSRLLHLLQIADCRNVVVVVSRWFGGTLLGPSRFAHINNCARDLLEKTGFISRDNHSTNSGGGKKKGGGGRNSKR